MNIFSRCLLVIFVINTCYCLGFASSSEWKINYQVASFLGNNSSKIKFHESFKGDQLEPTKIKLPLEISGQVQQSTPEVVIRNLYRQHDKANKTPENDKFSIIQSKSRIYLDKFFDKNLADLIWNDLKTHTDEVGVIDFDVFYNTQDADIKNLSVGQAKIEGSKATVPVSFTNYDAQETVIFLLVKQNDGWKINDIKYSNSDTLLKYFKEDAENTKAYNNFKGNYQVGNTTCTVKARKMNFEIQWAKGSGTMLYYFDGKASGKYSFSSEDTGRGKDTFIFDNEFSNTGKFIRADGKEMAVKKIN